MGLTPSFKVIAESKNITPLLVERLLELTIKDNAGIKSDTFEIRLDDKNNDLEVPRYGAELEVFLGYKANANHKENIQIMGRYIVDEVDLIGPPDTVVIRGKAADLNKGLKEPKTRTWQKPGATPERIPLKDILDTIASEHGLTPKLGADFAAIDYDVVNQTNETDLNFLTRLARNAGAIAKPANGFLLFVKRGEAKTVSGKKLPAISLTRKQVTSWHVSLIERGDYASVVAKYRDTKEAKEVEITAGSGTPVYTIRKSFKDAAKANEAAKAQLEEFQRGKSTVNIQLPGDPSLIAEAPLYLSGFRTGVNGSWVIETATHSYTNSGYSVTLDGKTKAKK
ncbi:phage late control D [gamma proteobacterium IMCC1989]|nr:phage late control D [gamma proteobacterium IMCC1989]